jgi:hypothetical protein
MTSLKILKHNGFNIVVTKSRTATYIRMSKVIRIPNQKIAEAITAQELIDLI